MKKLFRILLVIILLIIAAVIILPFALKGKITTLAKEEINKSINATVDFKDINLGLFRSFPHLSLGIEGISVVNKAPFEGDTLFAANDLSVTIDLFSALSGAPYEIRKISIDKPHVELITLEDGSVNWDIAPESGEETATEEQSTTEADAFTIQMKHLSIRSGRLIYDDRSLPFLLDISGMDHDLSGDLSASSTRLETKTSAEKLLMVYDGVPYLNGVEARINTGFDADLDNFVFNFRDGEIYINALKILASGSFGMPEEGYDMDIAFNAPGTAFSEVLSLVPAIYAKDFEAIETRGSFALSGAVKGRYSEEQMPAFNADIKIQDGYFKYPDLPSAVEEVRLACKIDNKTGDPDNTIVDLSEFHMLMAGAPVDASLFLSTPISDPAFKASLITAIDLELVQQVYPLEEMELSGKIDGDLKVDAKMSSIENQDYKAIDAEGQLAVTNISYVAEGSPSVNIPKAIFKFSPQQLELNDFNLQAGNSNLRANGYLSNYLAWFLDEDVLKGRFDLIAGTLDLNEFMSEESEDIEDPESTDSSTMSVIHIPENIDFTLNTNASEVLFGDLALKNVKGQLRVINGSVQLNGVDMEVMEGRIRADGTYRAPAGDKPYVNMDLDLRDISIAKAYAQSGLMRKLAPVAEYTTGRFSTGLKMSGFLDEGMMPEYSSLSGAGSFSTSQIIISDMPVLKKISDVLSVDKFSKPTMDKIQASFEVKDGRVDVKPFPIKVDNIKGDVAGSTGFDQSMDYTMNLEIPRTAMGSAANDLISKWTSQAAEKGLDVNAGNVIKVAVLIGGTITDPTVRTGFKDMASSLKEEVKAKVEEKIEEVKQDIKEEAGKQAEKLIKEAEQQAAKIKAEAKTQADKVRAAGYDAAAKVREEAAKQADKMVAEGKKKGPIAAAIAEKAADKVRKEADDKAKGLENEANKKADQIVNEANKRGDNIIDEARKKAEEL